MAFTSRNVITFYKRENSIRMYKGKILVIPFPTRKCQLLVKEKIPRIAFPIAKCQLLVKFSEMSFSKAECQLPVKLEILRYSTFNHEMSTSTAKRKFKKNVNLL